jgi:hypothetical protein
VDAAFKDAGDYPVRVERPGDVERDLYELIKVVVGGCRSGGTG